MTLGRQEALRIAIMLAVPIALVVSGLVLFKEILLPFLVGLAAAYMLDPAADRLERLHFGRTSATAVITITFFAVLTLLALLLLPTLAAQAAQLASELPDYVERLRGRLLPLVTGLLERFNFGENFSAEGLIQGQAGQAISVIISWVTGLLQSGVALLNLVALMFVTPIVTFYMLRDWDRMVAKLRGMVPPRYHVTADFLGRQIDEVLAGYVRGQVLVCSFLSVFYAAGLWAIDLRYGLIIGLLTGFFSFIPFIGMALGMAVGISVAAVQFQDFWMILGVAGIFGLGQFIEGNLISPRLVGSRIHLHPVWMIFAVLGGTALFGFLGTLLAVPFAAVLGVIVRFTVARYRESAFFDQADQSTPHLAEASADSAPTIAGSEKTGTHG